MEPRIQYATTADGVSIAFWTLGEGMPLVVMPAIPWSHIQMEWESPDWRRMLERLGQARRLVRYDNRGSGLSEREVGDYSLDAHVRDLEAVMDRLSLGRFALLASLGSGPVGIAYAARHPERVSHLFLWCTSARGPDQLPDSIRTQALRDLAEKHWEAWSDSQALSTVGWTDAALARQMAMFFRECTTWETVRGFDAELNQLDVTALLPQVQASTLVVDRRGRDLAATKYLASRIPDARVSILEGSSAVPFIGDYEPVVRAMEEFLGEGEEVKLDLPELPSGTAIILFADIVDSTALTERMGDAAFRAKARELDGALRKIIGESGGRPIEGPTLGDGILATFASARQAIEAALACGKAGDDAGLPLHLGLHAGDVLREADADGRSNVYGGAVNIASRISGLSAPGEVLVSETVRSLARTSAGVGFEDRGEQVLKGVGEAVRVWAVREDYR